MYYCQTEQYSTVMAILTDIISIDTESAVSKYRQIVLSVMKAIDSGLLKTGDKIPSINTICHNWKLSRDTVVIAYNELKSLGIIASAPGKGFYVSTTNIQLTNNIFLLFDELNSFKEDLYNSFLENLPPEASADIYFHYFNRRVFDQLIAEAKGNYTTFVVMPARFKNTLPVLEQLSGRVIILDQLPDDLRGVYPAIYQDFEADTYQALLSGKELLMKYNRLIMVHPGGKEPEGQWMGFERYCNENKVSHEIIHKLKGRSIKGGEAYIVTDDRDLVWLMKEAAKKGLKPGVSIGIVSYNDKPLKEVAGNNGITTISTDFKQMGKTLAAMVSDRSLIDIKNPSSLIIRGSL